MCTTDHDHYYCCRVDHDGTAVECVANGLSAGECDCAEEVRNAT